MLVSATRTVSALTLRLLLYGALFIFVVLSHLALASALRPLVPGPPVASQFAAGAVVLAVVLVAATLAERSRARRAAVRERRRVRQRLPDGPCCVIWDDVRTSELEAGMPWRPAAPLRPKFPVLARALGVEGVAVVEFEVGPQSAPENIRLLDAWPSHVFYNAARRALQGARFRLKRGATADAGARWRMVFVFRIAELRRRRR